MTPRFLVEHFEVTGVLDMAPRGFTYLLTMDNGESWSLNLGKYWRPRRFLGLRITAIGPRCGERVIEVLRLYIHDADGGAGIGCFRRDARCSGRDPEQRCFFST